MYSSTCFGHPHTYHQELNNCSSSLLFYRWSVVVAVLLAMDRPVATATAVVELLMMGVRTPETC